jgi:hypothetical protein
MSYRKLIAILENTISKYLLPVHELLISKMGYSSPLELELGLPFSLLLPIFRFQRSPASQLNRSWPPLYV